ncbi:sulfite exporter TauE/SafE family protein [Variovorax sp. RKNM96]|uniref:sulfite exporter TauE/SafE family protein n=1 Tax=Variovorax sp. RKNM96 TaxID=2681552 RepID=UPI0019814F7C|nr:sulfite exporter TauE/SafE family protein [Variovorax sp. RKNM96]QSI31965.1 sulfite exporter TauE/SafE family protein [Variovorax sp. RKNM96]
MQLALAGAALLMGLAGGPHCVAMCGAASAAVIRIVPRMPAMSTLPAGSGAMQALTAPAAFHLGRIASYAVAGAIAAASVDSLAEASAHVAALRPLWVLMHVFVFAWGAMLAVTGRQPLWAQRIGRGLESRLHPLAGRTWLGVLATGMLWVALPCGLLYSALMMASLGNGPLQGAGLMTLFALGSGASLLLGPWLWQRFRWAGGARQAWGARLAGVLLAGVAAHAVWADLIRQIDAWCR